MKELKPAILLLIAFTIMCGGIYPAIVTGVARAVFPQQAAGSFMVDNSGAMIGSRLVGQPFSELRYFWPRPSATGDFSYNPMASGGSNAGPTNPDYLNTVSVRVGQLRASGMNGPIPSELVQASASGLDPHISPATALIQVPRIAHARGVKREVLEKLIANITEDRQFGFLGVPRVNVLVLNTELDKLGK